MLAVFDRKNVYLNKFFFPRQYHTVNVDEAWKMEKRTPNTYPAIKFELWHKVYSTDGDWV